MTDGRQCPEEMAAQVADGSAAAVLDAWIMGVRELRQWPTPLGLMTPELRLTCAQAYVVALEQAGGSADRAMAQPLADVQHPAWPEFCEWLQASIDEMFEGWPELLGVASRPRPVDLDHELVVLVPYGDMQGPTSDVPGLGPVRMVEDVVSGSSVPQRGFLMRRDQQAPAGWLVAGWNGDRHPEPGWPPEF